LKTTDFAAPRFAPLSSALRQTLPPLLACFLWLNPLTLSAAEDEVPADLVPLDALVDDSRFVDAYALAQTLLLEWEGEPQFDFLYGTAALESGHANEAIFAFERLVQSYPDEPRFKLELARAQFEQHNLSASRELFEQVLATNPDATVRGNIQAFLDAIDDRENSTRSRLTWFVSTMLGNDTNINSATQLGVINTPIGDVELQPSGQAIEDTFIDLAGGLSYVKPLNKLATVNFNASYTKHNNIDTHDFDLDVLVADASYTRTYGNVRLSGGGRVQKVNLAGDSFQNSASLIATAQRNAGNGWTQAATVAYTGVRYDTGNTANANLRDVNQWLVSGMLNKLQGSFSHTVSVFYGDETARHDAGENNAQKFYGVALIEQFQWRPGHIPYLRLSLQHSENKAPAPIFNLVREADLFSTSLGWQWRVNGRLNVSTDLTYIDNDANLDLFAYDRLKFQTGVRYQF
jgi:tetratricopeptide (TPR) repeat protein